MNTPTERQGQFLAYIHQYMVLNGCAPAEQDMLKFFRISPPSVHSMVIMLEKKGFIERTPGASRSIRLLVDPDTLPKLLPSAQQPNTHSVPESVPVTVEQVRATMALQQFKKEFVAAYSGDARAVKKGATKRKAKSNAVRKASTPKGSTGKRESEDDDIRDSGEELFPL